MDSPAVASLGIDGEGGVLADGVGVVVVVALPGVVVVVEDEVPSQEEHLRPHLTALAHPLSVQPDGQVRLGGQDGWVVLVRAVDDSARDTRAVVVLKQSREKPSVGITWAVQGNASGQPLCAEVTPAPHFKECIVISDLVSGTIWFCMCKTAQKTSM